MLIVLFALCVFIVFVISTLYIDKFDVFDIIAFVSLQIVAAFTLAFIIIWISSYNTYLDCRSFYDATVIQYRDQITMYKNEAQLDVKALSYTDFKYEGYQKEMATNIRTLTDGVVKYNKLIIEKRIMKKNLFFSWLIVSPDDDMVTISLIERKK